MRNEYKKMLTTHNCLKIRAVMRHGNYKYSRSQPAYIAEPIIIDTTLQNNDVEIVDGPFNFDEVMI